MISKLSNNISKKLCYMSVISKNEQELYAYGFFLLLSRIFFLIVAAIWGILLEVFWESILFYILFSILRGYAGGAHASAENVCMGFTAILLFMASLCCHLMEMADCTVLAICILLLGSAVVSLLSPLVPTEKPLDYLELLHYRWISRAITITLALSGITAAVMKVHQILYIVSICVCFESILLLFGQAKSLRSV